MTSLILGLASAMLALSATGAAAAPAGWILAGGGGCQCINEYNQAGHNQQVAGQIGGVPSLSSMAVGADGTLYAVQLGSQGQGVVAIYPPGKSRPTVQFGVPYGPSAIAVARDGTLYVGSFAPYLFMYHQGRTKPFAKIAIEPSYFGSIPSVTVDPATQNVYLEYTVGILHIYFTQVFEIEQNAFVRPLSIYPPLNGITMVVDARSNLVISFQSKIEVFPPGKSSPSRTFGQNSEPLGMVLSSDDRYLYVTDGTSFGIRAYDYATGRVVNTITSGWGPGNVPGPITLAPSVR